MNFSAKLKLCAQKPARTQSPKTLPAILSHMRINFCLMIFVFMSVTANGQKLSRDFKGRVIYEIDNYSEFIDRDSCGDFKELRIMEKSEGLLEFRDKLFFDQEVLIYAPFKLARSNKSVLLIHFNQFEGINDTIEQFPMEQGDTIYRVHDYLLIKDKSGKLSEAGQLWNSYSNTTNLGDTTIIVLGRKYNCYQIEKFEYNRKFFSGLSHLRRIIYFDRKSLIPLQEEWWVWHNHHFCREQQKWLMSKRIKIVAIENGR